MLFGSNGVSVWIMMFGVMFQLFNVFDCNGCKVDIMFGYDDVVSYMSVFNFWGQIIGCYVNCIVCGCFMFDGKFYQFLFNDKINMLYGGIVGFDKYVWIIVLVESGVQVKVVMIMISFVGDQGYFGMFVVKVIYVFDDKGVFMIDFDVISDVLIIVNFINYVLFDLVGEGFVIGIYGQCLMIFVCCFMFVDVMLILIGELKFVVGIVFDFIKGWMLLDGFCDGCDLQIVVGCGWDYNFVFDKGVIFEFGLVVCVEDLVLGCVLEVLIIEFGV